MKLWTVEGNGSSAAKLSSVCPGFGLTFQIVLTALSKDGAGANFQKGKSEVSL